MRRGIVALGALVAAGASAGTVSAVKPGSGELTAAASKPQVTYGRSAAISGQLKRAPAGGQQVTLEQDPYPFNKFDSAGSATTDAAGNYSFSVKPGVSTRYRVVSAGKPKLTSGTAQINVAIRVTRRVSDRTPARGQRVRFRGSVAPALAGRPVTIERRRAGGSWRAVATTTANAKSRYAKRVRIRHGGYYRATVVGTDPGLLTGHSRRIRLRVH